MQGRRTMPVSYTHLHVKHTGKNAIMIYSAGEVENQNSGGEAGRSGYKDSAYSEYASTIYALTLSLIHI